MSSTNLKMNVTGVPEVLRALKKVDPELRKRVPQEIKSYAAPLLAEVKAGYPAQLLPGWSTTGRLGYRPGAARSKTTLRFRGSRPKGSPRNAWPVLRLVAALPAVAMADMARVGRTRQGAAMVRALGARYGTASRFVWGPVERHAADIERGIEASFERYAAIVNRELGAR